MRSRRKFLKVSALSAGALSVRMAGLAPADSPKSISLVVDPGDPVAISSAVRWATEDLRATLERRGFKVRQFDSIEQAPASGNCITVAGRDRPQAAAAIRDAGVALSHKPEGLALLQFAKGGGSFLLACGGDARGLMFALLELKDRVEHSSDPMQALLQQKAMAEEPFNTLRSIGRLFVSDVEDKPWFNDREMWPAYFTMLATQRFNRFSLNLGIGYDDLKNVVDAYFLFPYPFLLEVPGYKVRAVNLPDAERDRNLETLQFISSQAVAHGVDFQLGLWTHGYQWKDSPHANYTIEGLTPENHGAYCRDALAALLKACPAVSGVTLRTHAESGVREGSYAFWKTVAKGARLAGRTVNIDLHTKGLDEELIGAIAAVGMPLTLSPKYWAEHMGLPYHQAAIRELEMPREKFDSGSFSALSTGSRIFTRYGYADFLRSDRPYKIMYRIWPGTHRFLLWGDPVSTAAHARAFGFCGSDGVELFEPLSFKGRRGSGIAGGRCAYADSTLTPRWDWEKYLYSYRVWGRLMYNPEAAPDVWQRSLGHSFHEAAPAVEAALASATRILPLVTTAHLPSAANETYGPELCLNQSMIDPTKSPYGDTPAPKVFGNVSPLDPQLFLAINEFVAEMLKRERSGKYSPVEVARWLEELAETADIRLKEAEKQAHGSHDPEFRRMAMDVTIQIGLGRFFAAKLRSGVLYAIHEQSGSRAALEEAIKGYRRARENWSQFAEEAKGAYVSDISFGPNFYHRGHWLDRVAAIDSDIGDLSKRLASLSDGREESDASRAAVREALGNPDHPSIQIRHSPPSTFVPGESCQIILLTSAQLSGARLCYRHVNQAERYQTANMVNEGGTYRATIPGTYTESKYPLQYYFEVRQSPGKVWLYPGLGADLGQCPYYVVRKA